MLSGSNSEETGRFLRLPRLYCDP